MRPLLPEEHRAAVKRGVSLRTVHLPEARSLQLALLFREGAQGDRPGRSGATNLAVRLLFEGTRRRDTHGLTGALEGLGLHYSAEVRHEASILRFSIPRNFFRRALSLIGEMLFEPGYRGDDFDRLRGQTVAVLEKEANDPGVTAGNDLNALLMRGTPQAAPPKGIAATVGGLTLAEATDRREALLRGGVQAVACGRMGSREREALEAFLERFPAARSQSPPLRSLKPAPPGIYFHPWPGAVQSEWRLGSPGPVPGTPVWFPSLLLNTLLGGKFTSRLNLNLRETHGFTYGVRSYFLERRALSCFCVAAAVATGVTVPALRELLRELDGMKAPDFDPKEIADAAGFLAGSFHYALDNPALYLSRIVEREILGLPAGHFRSYLDFLDRAPRADLSTVPRAHFDRKRALLVVVGDPGVRSKLKALGLPLREV